MKALVVGHYFYDACLDCGGELKTAGDRRVGICKRCLEIRVHRLLFPVYVVPLESGKALRIEASTGDVRRN
jgi:hypothetical protein